MSNEKGLSLFEVLVSVVILSVGIIAIYQPMLRNISVLHDAEYRVIANRISHNEIWKVQESAERFKKLPQANSGVITYHNKVLTQSFSFDPIKGSDKLYLLKATTSWKSGVKIKNIQRISYVSTAS